MPMDVQDEASVERAVTATVTQFSRLDILVNNAGLVQVEAAWEATARSWQAVIERNLTGAFYCAKHAARTMIAAGQGGKIINISSVMAHLGPPDFASYATSKAGLLGPTRALAVELAPYDTQVNALLPGYFETEVSAGVPDWLREQIIRRVPAGRWAEPDELVGAAILLAAPASRYMTGSTLTVDGGYSIAERARYL
jgi:2-dehydro-3-deoxy-D-gluconate 5-dehydrogenase